MRKLAAMMGEDAFKAGIREYLAEFKYGNATWDDLIAILAKHTDEDVAGFSRTWVDQPYWPEYQALNCSDAEDSERYGLIRLNPAQTDSIMSGRPMPEDPVRRLALLMNLNENYLTGRIADMPWLRFLMHSLSGEEDALIAAAISGYMAEPLLSCHSAGQDAGDIEAGILEMSENHSVKSVRTLLLRLLAKNAFSQDTAGRLYEIWSSGEDGRLSQRDNMTLAYELAVRMPDKAKEIIDTQRGRLRNPDLLREFDFISRAVTPSEAARDSLFASLGNKEERRIEPWTQAVLYYLNHPLRSASAVKYIRPALELLPEIQRTGDIFFPAGWCSNLLAGHRSVEARIAVRQYLDDHPELNPMLRSKVLQAGFRL